MANPFDDPTVRRQYYGHAICAEIPRLLSAMDRCPVSPTRGCLDREYWAWATKDFANQDLQRGLLALSYVYTTRFTGNCYYGEKNMVDWISAGIRFWIGGQNTRGAFDHLYPYENSWMATAFTLNEMVTVYQLMAGQLESAVRKKFLGAMCRAGDHLTGNNEEHGFISNHLAGGASALIGLSRLSGRKDFSLRAHALMDSVYEHQSDEGWFLEYEGADPGYQTLDTHYQASYYLRSGRPRKTAAAVDRSLEFLSCCIHPDDSLGGDYGSRNCPHFFPGGFEVFAPQSPVAEAVVRRGVKGLDSHGCSGLADADVRNSVPLLSSYVLAHQALHDAANGRRKCRRLPCQKECERFFPQAGLYFRSTKRHYVVFGAAKGGVTRIFDKESSRLIGASSGYVAEITGGGYATTQLWTSSPDVRIVPGLSSGETKPVPEQTVTVRVPFYFFQRERLMGTPGLLLFRLFNLTLGRIPTLNNWIRRHVIIRLFLTGRRRLSASLHRSIHCSKDGIRVDDRLHFDRSVQLKKLEEFSTFATVYMASARYFRWQDFYLETTGGNLADKVRNGHLQRTAWSMDLEQKRQSHRRR